MYSTWIVVQEVELVVAVVSRFLCRHGCGWILNLCVLIIFFGLSNCNCALWGLGMSWVCRVTWLMCKHICMPQWVTYLLCLAVYDNYTRKRIVSQRWACHGCGENCSHVCLELLKLRIAQACDVFSLLAWKDARGLEPRIQKLLPFVEGRTVSYISYT